MDINYDSLLAHIEDRQQTFRTSYSSASTNKRADITAKSKGYISHMIIDSLIPAWLGTPYDFNGTTEVPREGTIACGYFVSTVLKHAGFRLNRFALAKQPSGNIIRSVTDEIKQFPYTSLSNFIKEVKKMDQGIYILGLDSHVGFIVHDQSELKFCHAAYYAPYEVTCEQAGNARAVINSSYRVIGKVLNERMIKQWVAMRKIKTVR